MKVIKKSLLVLIPILVSQIALVYSVIIWTDFVTVATKISIEEESVVYQNGKIFVSVKVINPASLTCRTEYCRIIIYVSDKNFSQVNYVWTKRFTIEEYIEKYSSRDFDFEIEIPRNKRSIIEDFSSRGMLIIYMNILVRIHGRAIIISRQIAISL